MEQAINYRNNSWQIIGKSVRGTSHLRNSYPNQDAIEWLPKNVEEGKSQNQFPYVLAIADGHGSSKSFRSNKGAEIAVKVAIDLIPSFLIQIEELICLPESDPHLIKAQLEDKGLLSQLVETWKIRVKEDIQANPFEPEDFISHLSKESKVTISPSHVGGLADEDNKLIIYGATLLVVVILEYFALYLQLGDGDILEVTTDGKVARPLPSDVRLFANETTSLCSPAAAKDFRVYMRSLENNESFPKLILVSTDGYANSFSSDEDFLKVGPDLLKMIKENGLELIDQHLEEWLNETSATGSGDDITVGLIYNSFPMNGVLQLAGLRTLEDQKQLSESSNFGDNKSREDENSIQSNTLQEETSNLTSEDKVVTIEGTTNNE